MVRVRSPGRPRQHVPPSESKRDGSRIVVVEPVESLEAVPLELAHLSPEALRIKDVWIREGRRVVENLPDVQFDSQGRSVKGVD